MQRSTARVAATGLLLVSGAFQAALAAGAPWGRAAYGGQNSGVLPARLRMTSAVATPVYVGLAGVVWLDRLPPNVQRSGYATAAVVFAAGSAMNAASRSPVERALWTPVAAALAVSLWRSRPPGRN